MKSKEEEYLEFLLHRRSKSLGRGPGINIKPSDIPKVRQSHEVYKKWGGSLRFHEEPNVQIDLSEVVERFPYLTRIFVAPEMTHLDSLEKCRILKSLQIGKRGGPVTLDLSKIKTLEVFSFGCDHSNINFESKSITEIYASSPSFNDLSFLSACPELQELHLFDAKLETLKGIENFKSLHTLRMINCRKLTSLEQLKGIAETLKHLELDRITKNLDLNAIEQLKNLETLTIEGIGSIPDIQFCKALQKLRSITLSRVNVLDGKLRILMDLAKLERSFFTNKPHYDLKEKDLNSFFEQRSTGNPEKRPIDISENNENRQRQCNEAKFLKR
ncbi:MAG: hypothetical protein QNJ29_08315 [Rhizobiaceae bacterium]|nr:hypothetical protein [Rhizobiaceae bacterium]